MPGIGGFDVVTQLRDDVVSDLLTRLLGDASTQDPTSSGYVPGQLIYPPAPLQPETMVWWDAPKVALTDDQHATLSLALHGGVRQAPSAMDQGRIGTLSGTVTGRMRPVLGTTAGAQHLSLALDGLDLGGLRVAYGESNALPLGGIGGTAQPLRDAIVEAVVRDVLSSAMLDALLRGLLTGMGRLPLIYSMSLTGVQTVGKATGLRVFSAREGHQGSVLAIASPLPGMVGDTQRVENALVQRPDSNMAVSVSSVALTAVAMQLLSTGKIARQMRAPDGAQALLESIGVQAHAGYLTLATHVASGPVKATAALNATLTLDRTAARLQVGVGTAHVELDTLLAGTADEAAARGQVSVQTVSAGLGAAFWGEVLAALLGARYRDGALELVPVLSVPGSGVRVVGTLTGLEFEDGHLTLYCSVPTDATYTGQKPDKQPQVTTTQSEIPLQAAPGAPVRTLVEAQVSTESYRPYDFAWKATAASALLPVRGARLEMTGTPTGRAGDPEPIGKAHVVLIDSFGQVASADGAAQVHPAKRQPNRRLRRLVQACVAAALIAALTLGGIAFAGGLPFLGGTTPTPTATATATAAPGVGFVVSPVSPVSVACSSLSAQAPLGPIVFDNNAGQAGTPWQASIADLAPGGGEPWASFASGGQTASGMVPAGQTEQIQLQPARDLCRRVYDTKAQQTFHVAVTYGSGSGAGQASAIFNVGVSLVAVSVQTTASQSKTSNTTLTQICNSSTNPVQPFGILLDGRQGTAATPYQIVISDPPPSSGGTVTPTPGGPPVWATADSSSGTVQPGGQQTVTITPAANLCAGVPQGQSVNLHVGVQLAPGTQPVQITDTVESLIP